MTTLARLFAVDLRSLALLRIGIATLILVDLADRAVFLRAHYTDLGLFTRADAARAQLEGQWSLHLMAGTEAGQTVLFVVAAAFAVLLLLGWRTRWVAIVCWLLLVSLQARTPPLAYGADGVLRALLFYAMFLPVGARWSVDELRGRAAGRAPRADEHRSVPAAALVLQIVLIYVFTGLLKLGDPSWLRLESVFYALAGDHHATQLGLWVSRFPAVTKALALVTLLLEIVAPLFLFVPIGRARIRIALVLVFCAFHVVTSLTMYLGLFPWVSCLAWLALLPREAWERAGSATRSGDGNIDELVVREAGRPRLRGGAAARAALALAGVSLAFASSLDHALPNWSRPTVLVVLARAASLEQRWSMFTKPMHDGWIIVAAVGTTTPGAPPREMDVMRGGAPLTYDRPEVIALQFKSMRWRKYFTDITFDRWTSKRNRRLLLRYVCRTWNAGAQESERIARVDLIFMQADDLPDGTQAPVQRKVLASRDCMRAPVADPASAPYFERKPAGAPHDTDVSADDADEPDAQDAEEADVPDSAPETAP